MSESNSCPGCDCAAHVGLCSGCFACYGCLDRNCRCLEWKAEKGQAYIANLSQEAARQDYYAWRRAHRDEPTVKPATA